MGQTFDRVAIALTPDGAEYLVLESQLMIDFGDGQGPRGGVITVEDGWIAINGAGEARLSGGLQEQGGNFPPRVTLADAQKKTVVEIAAHADPTGEPPLAQVYLEGTSATMRMRDAAGNVHALLEGAAGNLWLGGKAADGDIALFASGEPERKTASATVHLNGQAGQLWLRGTDDKGKAVERVFVDASLGDFWLGGNGVNGDIVVFPSGEPDTRDASRATAHLNGTGGQLRLRAPDDEGNLVERIFLDATGGDLWLGGNGVNGDLAVFDKGPRDEDTDEASIRLKGSSGDIILQNADCAEDFDVAEGAEIEPGTLMVLDRDGRLQHSCKPYDTRVAGVISGGGVYKPGIVLDRHTSLSNRLPLALLGKTFCKVDAEYAAIEVGDLLTTSATLGHAMKASDASRAFGAVVGKALSPMRRGTGLIPILICLQ